MTISPLRFLSSEQRSETLRLLEREAERRRTSRSVEGLARHLGHVPARHHELICREIEWAFETPWARLVICAPPGSAKSRYLSQIAPAVWFARQVGRPGDHGVMVATHTQALADDFGAKTRRIVAENADLLGYGISADASAKARWDTTTGREYLSVGVGVGISGRRPGAGFIDDLYPGRAEADSQVYRDRVWAWLLDDFLRRPVPGAPIIAVNTRWHEDDYVGRLIDIWRRTGQPVRFIEIRAEAEDGDVLGRAPGEMLGKDWAGWDYPQVIRTAKAEMIAAGRVREYEALFQQRPSAAMGDYFHRDWIRLRKAADVPKRETMRFYLGSDYAVTEGGGDWTVHAVVGLDPAGDLWLVDLWRERAASDRWVEAWCDLVMRWRPVEAAEETGQIRSGVGPFLMRRAMERGAYVVRRQFVTRGDKAIRAQSMRARMAMRGLNVPEDAPWVNDLIHELVAFPSGKHDDIVDALGLVGQLLDTMEPGRPIEVRKPEPPRGIERATLDEILSLSAQREDDW